MFLVSENLGNLRIDTATFSGAQTFQILRYVMSIMFGDQEFWLTFISDITDKSVFQRIFIIWSQENTTLWNFV